MAHYQGGPTSASNGASLEDCHTNFFALADLNGIKWRRLSYPKELSNSSLASVGTQQGPLEDPVLGSFARCLQAGLLCAWRRVPRTDHAGLLPDPLPPGPPEALAKELWLFWCGDEPDTSSGGLLSHQLVDLEQGSWENGLGYDTRNLLFKALHNLVQRCLLQRGFVRLGRWFLQPTEWVSPHHSGQTRQHSQSGGFPSGVSGQNARGAATTHARPNPLQITFAFNFFVHGDSTVCVGVDVRQHPAIQKLSRAHLAACQQAAAGGPAPAASGATSAGGTTAAGATASAIAAGVPNGPGSLRVLLSPYGLQAMLLGAVVGKDADSASSLLNEWNHYYPLPPRDNPSGSSVSSTAAAGGNENCPPNLDSQHGPSVAGPGSEAAPAFGSGSSAGGQVPPVVNVQVGTVRMKYPSAYVFVSETDEVLHGSSSSTVSSLNGAQGGVPTSQKSASSTKNASPPRSILSAALASKDAKEQSMGIETGHHRVALKNLAPEENSGTGRCITSGGAPRAGRPARATAKMIRGKAWADATSAAGLPAVTKQVNDQLNEQRTVNESEVSCWQLKELTSCGGQTPSCGCFRCAPGGPLSSCRRDDRDRKKDLPPRFPGLRPGSAGMFHKRRGSPDIPSALDSILANRLGLGSVSSSNGTSQAAPGQQTNVANANEDNSNDKMAPPLSTGGGSQPTPGESRSVPAEPTSLASLLSPMAQTKVEPGTQMPIKFEPPNSVGAGLPPGHSPVSTPGESSRALLGGLSPLNEDGVNQLGLQVGVSIKQEIIGSAPPSVANMDCCSTPAVSEATKPGREGGAEAKDQSTVTYTGSVASTATFGSPTLQGKKQGSGNNNGNVLKRPTLPWVAHEDDDLLPPALENGSALYDYSAVRTALVWDAPPPTKRTFPLRVGSDRWNQNPHESGSGPWSGQNLHNGVPPAGGGFHGPPAAGGHGALHNQHSVDNGGTDENQGSDSGGEQISADDNALLGSLCVSPSEVTSAALTPLSSGPHSNNPSTPRQYGTTGHGHLQTAAADGRHHQTGMAATGTGVATPMDCGTGDCVPLDNMSSSSEGIGDVGSPDNGLLFPAPGSVGAKTPLCHMSTPPQHHGAGDDLHRKTTGFMELTTMYPTPPSLEPNAAASPCNGPGTPSAPTHVTIADEETPVQRSEPGGENNALSMFVHRPAVLNKLVTSDLYAPVDPLPSSQQAPISLPAECVYRASWQNRMNASNRNASNSNGNTNQKSSTVAASSSGPAVSNGQIQHRRHPDGRPNSTGLRAWGPEGGRPAPPYPLGSPGYSAGATPGQTMMSPAGPMVGSVGPMSAGFGASRPSSVDPYQMSSGPPSVRETGSSSAPVDKAANCPEVSGLLVTLFLSDSQLDIFRDHNFTSCTICVCNMNIKGADVPLYMPSQLLSGPALNGYDDPQYKCTCGFSAVVNRQLSYQAGLFYEDEVEITGIPYEPAAAKSKLAVAAGQKMVGPKGHQGKNGDLSLVPAELLSAEKQLVDYVQRQCLGMTESPCTLLATLSSNCASSTVNGDLSRSAQSSGHRALPPPLSSLALRLYRQNSAEKRGDLSLSLHGDKSTGSLHSAQLMADSCQVTALALEAALVGGLGAMVQPSRQWVGRHPFDEATRAGLLHRWAFLQVTTPPNHATVVKLLRSLQPILQDGVHNQRKAQKGPSQNMWEVTYRVVGPLTWRQFHRLAGRGTEDQCEPQPIPSLLVGYDKDWLSISPFALKYWDKLLLEPYAAARDVAYVVVCPDAEGLQGSIKAFFRELSAVYEAANLGRHCALNKSFRDGLLNVGSRAITHEKKTPGEENGIAQNANQPSPAAHSTPQSSSQQNSDQTANLPNGEKHTTDEWLGDLFVQLGIVDAPQPERTNSGPTVAAVPVPPMKATKGRGANKDKQKAAAITTPTAPANVPPPRSVKSERLKERNALLVTRLSHYSQACRLQLAPHLASISRLDKTLLEGCSSQSSSSKLQQLPTASPRAPNTPDNPATPSVDKTLLSMTDKTDIKEEATTGSGAFSGNSASINSSSSLSGQDPSGQQQQTNNLGGAAPDGGNSNSHGSQVGASAGGAGGLSESTGGVGGGHASPASSMASLQSGLNADDSTEPNCTPTIVLYIIDPTPLHATADEEAHRLTLLALHACFERTIAALPMHIRANVQLQIVPLDTILSVEQCAAPAKRHDLLVQTALSLFYQSGPTLPAITPPGQVKSLTGMGPAASQDSFIKRKMQNQRAVSDSKIVSNGPTSNRSSNQNAVTGSLEDVRTFNPPFILAPTKDKQAELGEMFGDHQERSSILFVSYCLSEDQRWLLASVSTERGELLRNSSINITIPDRTRRKRASARYLGLNKLMEFVLDVVSTSAVRPWRLVIGRLGRIGHGELKEWAALLSRKSLLRYSRHLRELCSQCGVLSSPLDVPCILSACLVSLEADSCLQVFADQCSPDERVSTNAQRCELSTPVDATCTHILVFPTSATTQSSQATFNHLSEDHMDLGNDDELFNTITQDMDGGPDNFDDIVNWSLDASPENPIQGGIGDDSTAGGGIGGLSGLRNSRSPNDDPMVGMMMGGGSGSGMALSNGLPSNNLSGGGGQGAASAGGCAGARAGAGNGYGEFLLGGEEAMQLLQQPLALGYLVSTAPAGPLPKWFWAACPHLETANPVFLKSALVLHSPTVHQNQDDILHGNQRNGHPLDSNLTTDVLRYVLEGYNALSWLRLSPTTHDRASCLPLHIQNLLTLYHAVHALL